MQLYRYDLAQKYYQWNTLFCNMRIKKSLSEVLTTDCVGWGSFCSWFKSSSEGCWPEIALLCWTLGGGLVVDALLWLALSSSALRRGAAAPLEGALAGTSGWICAVGRLLIRRLLRGEDCGWEGKKYIKILAKISFRTLRLHFEVFFQLLLST